MDSLKNIIEFYRDCYQHDLKGIRITNFISKNTLKRYCPNTNEFFHGDIDKIHTDEEWAIDVEKILLLDHKEKALYAGTYFIKGNKSILGKSTVSYIPLYIHELELVKIEEVFFVEILDTYLNPDFVEMLNFMEPQLNLNIELFEKELPTHPFGFEQLVQIESFFKDNCPHWDIEELFNYHDPSFSFNQHFEQLKKLKAGTKKISSALIIGIFNRPQGSLGVINELNSLSNTTLKSPLLYQFFGLKEIPTKKIKPRKIYIPASLSDAQSESIFKKDSSPISLILGPPGTGKSFTIACLTLDAICHDQSVLIISKNSQATRVISNIIENQFNIKGKLVKADNQRYKRGLASRLSKMINWSTRNIFPISRTLNKIHVLQEIIYETINKIIETEATEIEWGKFYSKNNNGFFSLFKDKWIQYKKSKTDLVWKLNGNLIVKKKQKNKLVEKYIINKLDVKFNSALKLYRTGFIKLVNALKEDNYTKLNERIHTLDFGLILNALPIWLTTTKQISGHLPLTANLFDLVIIDEASQCDIASFIPVIHRARSMIVVGDPQQLNHVSFLSDSKQRDLRTKYDLRENLPNYRIDSVIDWTNKLLISQDQVSFLNDHYRSKPSIINFSNQKFYNQQLNILRSYPSIDNEQSVYINYVDGLRDEKGINEAEADAVLKEIQNLVKNYNYIDKKISPTIGVSSPIRSQVNYIKSKVNDIFTNEVIRKHKILIGTPYHFQGEERDHVFISLAIDATSHFASINYLNKEDVFNVLISRARNKQHIFSSIKPEQLPHYSLLREYLEFKHEKRENHITEHVYDSFLEEIIRFLEGSKFNEIYTSNTVSGVEVDLTIIYNGKYYCIDLIGYPGNFERQFSARNIEILNRMNVPVYFIPYSCWVLNNHKTKKDLLRFLNQ